MKEKFDVNNYHETRIALLENSVTHIADTLKEIKQDIHGLRVELKKDIAELRTKLKSDIAELRTELKSDISVLRTEFKTDISELKKEFKEDVSHVDSNMKDIRNEIKEVKVNSTSQFRWIMGALISFQFSVIVAIVAKLI